MKSRAEIGRIGEDAAAAWLQRHGHRIISRNWRSGRVELDIVSEDNRGIHFVEVKTRKAPVMADPSVNVDYVKRRHLVRAAQNYLHSLSGGAGAEVFFDIITVVLDGDGAEINYYQQAFIPLYV